VLQHISGIDKLQAAYVIMQFEFPSRVQAVPAWVSLLKKGVRVESPTFAPSSPAVCPPKKEPLDGRPGPGCRADG
jgi:hypothetical protein